MPQTFAAEHWTQSRLRSCGTSETVSRSVPRSTSSATSLPILSPVSARIRSSAPVMAAPSRRQHDVAGFEAGAVGGAAGLDRADHHGAVLIKTGGAAQPRAGSPSAARRCR